MTERSGVEIDYCPACRGVWLDRGELDKIIERAAPAPAPPLRTDERDRRDSRSDRDRRPERDDDRPRFDDDWDVDRGSGPYRKKRKRESLLSELFDF